MLESVEVLHKKEVGLGECDIYIQLNFQGEITIGFCITRGMTQSQVAKRFKTFSEIMLAEEEELGTALPDKK